MIFGQITHDDPGCASYLIGGAAIVDVCSAVAASLFKRLGHDKVVHVADGGVGTWGALGNPIEHSPARDEAPA